MEPRELDRLVAEKVMGWRREGANYHTKPKHSPSKDFPGKVIDNWDSKGPHDFLISPESDELRVVSCGCESTTELPDYSASIESAWLVVNKFRDDGYAHLDLRSASLTWSAVFDRAGYGIFEATADTAALAICLAALKALGVELPDA